MIKNSFISLPFLIELKPFLERSICLGCAYGKPKPPAMRHPEAIGRGKPWNGCEDPVI